MFQWFFVASFIIVVPALVAVLLFPFIDKAFRPLAYNIWIGLLAEIVAHVFRLTIKNNLYVFNSFMLFDFITFLWLFKSWGAFTNINRYVRTCFFTFFALLWIVDNFYWHHLGQNNIIFRISYSLVIVLIAIDQLNNVVIKSNHSLKYNPYIYICVGTIFYYAYSIFISLFNSPLFHPTAQLWKWNMLIYVIINVVTNLLFAISFVWMRKKVKFI